MHAQQIDKTSRGFFSNIQAMRAVAALMIVLGHSLAFSAITLPVWLGGSLIHTFAYAGVDIFFVISGIVVCAAAKKSISSSFEKVQLEAFIGFVSKRLLRIYPIYWIVFAIVWFFSAYLPLALDQLSVTGFLSAFFLIEKANRIVPQAWSLVFELYFYLVLAISILFFSRHIYRSLIIWMLLSMLVFLALHFYGRTDFVVLDPLIFEFCFGCFIHYLISKEIRIAPIFCLTLGIAAFVLGAWFTLQWGLLNPSLRVPTFGIGAAFILYSLIVMELRWQMKLPAFLGYLGDISYSIYLWHELVIGLLLAVSIGHGNLHLVYPLSFLALVFFTVIAISALSYRWIERPLLAGRFFRSRGLKR